MYQARGCSGSYTDMLVQSAGAGCKSLPAVLTFSVGMLGYLFEVDGHVSFNACYHSEQNLLSSRLLSKNLKIKLYRTIILPVVCMGVKLGR